MSTPNKKSRAELLDIQLEEFLRADERGWGRFRGQEEPMQSLARELRTIEQAERRTDVLLWLDHLLELGEK